MRGGLLLVARPHPSRVRAAECFSCNRSRDLWSRLCRTAPVRAERERPSRRPQLVRNGVVGPERRVDRPGHPLRRDVRQHPVQLDRGLELAVLVRPAVELLGDPGGEPGRRIGQAYASVCGLVPWMWL